MIGHIATIKVSWIIRCKLPVGNIFPPGKVGQVVERIPVLKFADLSLDTGSRQATRGSRTISLTAKEYELLELFLRHPKQVLTREVIFDRVWGYDFGGESKSS